MGKSVFGRNSAATRSRSRRTQGQTGAGPIIRRAADPKLRARKARAIMAGFLADRPAAEKARAGRTLRVAPRLPRSSQGGAELRPATPRWAGWRRREFALGRPLCRRLREARVELLRARRDKDNGLVAQDAEP